MGRADELRKLLEKSPKDDFLLYGLALDHAKHGDHETALTYFNRAIEADPENSYHYFHKARSLEALERIDEALATLRAGMAAAKRAEDEKAISELRGYIEMVEINWSRT